jgi:heat shock protein HtpX
VNNTLKTALLLALLSGIFIVIGGALGGQTGMLLAFVLALVMNAGAYWFSGDLALRLAGAREISRDEAPELHRLVDELATYARLPSPRLGIIHSASPNAFATGRDPQHAVVAVTTGLLSLLSRDEVAAVLAHELAHVRNRDILIGSIAASLAGAVTLLANMAQWSMLFSHSDDDDNSPLGFVGAMLTIILAPIAASIIQLAISRSREFGADHTGARIHGQPESLARALEKLERGADAEPLPADPAAAHLFIVNPLTGGGARLSGLFSTHPPVAERIRRLRTMEPGALAA